MRNVQLSVLVIAVLFSFVAPALAQQQPDPAQASASFGVPEGRTFFPHHWLRGYTDFEVAPSHNEPDLDRCAETTAALIAGGNTCTAFARYMISGYLEIQPVGRTFLRHVYLFWTPRFSFGHNVPQVSYTAAFTPMAYERIFGVGIELPKNFEFRVSQHQVDWLGRYSKSLGSADLGTPGPYGLYATVGLRWYFGGYGRSHEM